MQDWMMKVWFYAVFGLIFLSQAVTADNKSAAQEFVNSKLDAVFEVLQQEDFDKPTKHSQITEIVTPMFDFQLMAKLSLGRKYWPDLTQENKERFTELFVKRLKQSYLNKITTYTDEKIMYEAPVEVKNKIHVPTYLISKGKKIEMLYKTYQSNDNWKIYDIEIQGVSIIRSYRSQFREILQKGTFDDLLQKLQKPVNN
jgi:phospholipid transport system substrate-binding protein